MTIILSLQYTCQCYIWWQFSPHTMLQWSQCRPIRHVEICNQKANTSASDLRFFSTGSWLSHPPYALKMSILLFDWQSLNPLEQPSAWNFHHFKRLDQCSGGWIIFLTVWNVRVCWEFRYQTRKVLLVLQVRIDHHCRHHDLFPNWKMGLSTLSLSLKSLLLAVWYLCKILQL